MDTILLFLAKPLDKHGTTAVHVTYPPLSDLRSSQDWGGGAAFSSFTVYSQK